MEKYSEIKVIKGAYKGYKGTVVMSDEYRTWCKLPIMDRIVMLRTEDLRYEEEGWEIIEEEEEEM